VLANQSEKCGIAGRGGKMPTENGILCRRFYLFPVYYSVSVKKEKQNIPEYSISIFGGMLPRTEAGGCFLLS
jgi:hypothetical protein